MNKDYVAKPNKNWLWFDLETTGTDECGPGAQILEFAAAVANDGPGGDFEIIDSVSGCIFAPGELSMSPFVMKMHAASGLLDDLMDEDPMFLEANNSRTVDGVDAVLSAFARPRFYDPIVGVVPIILAGLTPAFDWRWAREHLPLFFGLLSHRTFDVSTLKMEERAWLDPGFDVAETEKKHRALEDVKYSLKIAKEIARRRTSR